MMARGERALRRADLEGTNGERESDVRETKEGRACVGQALNCSML